MKLLVTSAKMKCVVAKQNLKRDGKIDWLIFCDKKWFIMPRKMCRKVLENMRFIPLVKKRFWDKSSKWNHPQFGGSGSENLFGLIFWPLFVTKNCILCFSDSGLIKWPWDKSSKWNHPQCGGRGSENLLGFNFWPLFVTKNCILCF